MLGKDPGEAEWPYGSRAGLLHKGASPALDNKETVITGEEESSDIYVLFWYICLQKLPYLP